MKKSNIIKLFAVCALLLLQISAASVAAAQQFSTDPQNPTPLESATISGKLVPQKNKSYYAKFLAGPGDVFFDVNISPKENKGAVFYWTIYRSTEDAVKDTPWCTENLYLETAKKTKCVISSGDNKTREVILKFGAYPNGEPVNLNYTIKLGGDWKPLLTMKPIPISLIDLSMREALYVDTFQQDKVDTKLKYATPKNSVTVFRSDNTNCDEKACGFQVGFFVFRNSAGGKLTTNVRVINGTDIKTEVVTFEPGKQVADVVVHMAIFNGNNKIRVEVDPQNQRPESNELNNRFEAVVVLKP